MHLAVNLASVLTKYVLPETSVANLTGNSLGLNRRPASILTLDVLWNLIVHYLYLSVFTYVRCMNCATVSCSLYYLHFHCENFAVAKFWRTFRK